MRAAVLLVALVAAAAIALLPVIRDELSWWWAESRDHAADFYTYLNTWGPNGRHAPEARLRYKQRQWAEGEKTLIRKAYQDAAHPNSETDVEYNKQKQMRRDAFLWKAATNSDTLKAYQDYISQFPQGKFAGQAHARIATLSRDDQGQAPVPH